MKEGSTAHSSRYRTLHSDLKGILEPERMTAIQAYHEEMRAYRETMAEYRQLHDWWRQLSAAAHAEVDAFDMVPRSTKNWRRHGGP
jgi:hypothetical protein